MGVSDIFYFFLLGEGKRDSGAPKNSRFCIENPGGGGGLQDERGRGAWSVCSELGNWKGGVKYFFSGPEMSTKRLSLNSCIGITAACYRTEAGYSWDIRDPDVGISRTKTLCKWPFSVVLDREWPGCPGIWVGTSRIWKNFMQENFGLIRKSAGKSAGKSAAKKWIAGGTAWSSAVSLLSHRKRLLPAVHPAVPFFLAHSPALSPQHFGGVGPFSVL